MAIARLHLITPTTIDDAALAATEAALAAGVSWLQVRQKDGTDRQRLDVTAGVLERCRRTTATCIVNDRADLAFAAGADGVHLGLDDVPVAAARRLLGPDAIIGATCRDVDDARRAEHEGASYLGVGPAYPSSTKATGLPDPLGPAGIAAVARAVPLPVIAISGVTVDRVAELLDAGAHGVAVVAAIYDADDPGGAAAELLDAVGEPARPAGART